MNLKTYLPVDPKLMVGEEDDESEPLTKLTLEGVNCHLKRPGA
jgi:hypothetical protein